MISYARPSSMVVLLGVALITEAALGQSLSLIKKGESEFWIKAAAPPETPHVLQASANLHLWVDIHEEVTGLLSNRLNTAGITSRFFRLIPGTPPPPPSAS